MNSSVTLRFALVAGSCLSLLLAGPIGCATDTQQQQSAAMSASREVAPAQSWTAIVNGKPAVLGSAELPIIEMGDQATLLAIIDEGVNRNQVMDHMQYLSGQIGTRLTGSTRMEQAAAWVQTKYRAWGLSNVHDSPWGTIATRFDRGPSTGGLWVPASDGASRPARPGRPAATGSAAANAAAVDGGVKASADKPVTDKPAGKEEADKKPTFDKVRDLQFTTLAWTPGTNGPVRGPIVRLPKDDAQYAEVKGSLAGAWVLLPPPPPVGQRGVRSRNSAIFQVMLDAKKDVEAGKKKVEELPIRERVIFDGVAGFISTSRDERVWTGAADGWRDRAAIELTGPLAPPPHVVMRLSDYDYLNSRMADGETVLAEFDLKNEISAGPFATYNTIAEIRGSGKPDEMILITGHMDTWDGPGSQGATDNGTGTAVTLEAARILAAAITKTGIMPKRTIRFIHWTGEEQGLLGSAVYVTDALANRTTDKISAVFVDDGGTNSQGGLVCIPSMVPMLANATAPSNGLFTDAVSGKPLNVNVKAGKAMPKGGGSDHASFNAKGVPGFFWDEVGRADYGFGWHTQNDRIELAVPEYLKQSSTNSAITAWRLANAPTLLPRDVVKTEEKDGDKPQQVPIDRPAPTGDDKGMRSGTPVTPKAS